MKGLVFFPGTSAVDILGAVNVVTRNLFPEPPSELEGAIIGSGRFAKGDDVSPAFHQIDLSPALRKQTTVYRLAARLCRQALPEHSVTARLHRWNDDKFSVIADKLASERLVPLLWSNPNIKVVLGYSGRSLAVGRTAKAEGRRYAVHCQWCHPQVQNTLVAEAYRSLELAPPWVSQAFVHRQLAEYELADVIWCPTESVRRSLVDHGVPAEKTFVTYLGVDVARFHVPEGTRHPEDPFLILFVGNVGVQKGVHVLLEALARADISEATVVFNGKADPVAQRLIQAYSPRLEMKKITLRVDPGDPRRYHKKASVFVLPSVHDSYGIVVPESMAAGLPVIVSDHAGAHEIIQHGRNGFVFPSGNAEALAEHIEFFYRDPAAREAFGSASRRIAEDYDLKAAAKRHRAGLFPESACV